MTHVKPQHSFRRVRPVLVNGEELCCALFGALLAATPENTKQCVRKQVRNVSVFTLCLLKENFICTLFYFCGFTYNYI